MRLIHQLLILTSYWNLHYHNLNNFCTDVVSHIISNEVVGGARTVYVKKFNISI